MPRRPTSAAAAAAAAVCAGACAGGCAGDPTTSDFREEAEKFIESADFAENPAIDVEITDATCTEPAATEIGTRFMCTGTAPDGTTYEFETEITGERNIAIGRAVGAAAPAATPTTTITPATTVAPTTTG